MPRPLRTDYPDAVYHVTSRGNAKAAIFESAQDRKLFFSTLQATVCEFDWICHAFVLMNNHHHLLIETPTGNLAEGMQQLNGRFAQRYNKERGRIGHVFQGRFKPIVVEKDSYFLAVARYVVLNPVRAGLVANPGFWKWSSYQATAGDEHCPFLSTAETLAYFANGKDDGKEQYRKFVMSGLDSSIWKDLRGGFLLSTDRYARMVAERLKSDGAPPELWRSLEVTIRKPLSDLLGNILSIDEEAILSAYHDHGYKQSEIAQFLGTNQTKISRLIRSHSEQ
jgi:REP element-mobilizing transposase RayT